VLLVPYSYLLVSSVDARALLSFPTRRSSDLEHIVQARSIVRHVSASRQLREYIVAILHASRNDPAILLGSSPRGGVHLLRAAKARAALSGRTYATPDDVQALAPYILA